MGLEVVVGLSLGDNETEGSGVGAQVCLLFVEGCLVPFPGDFVPFPFPGLLVIEP